MFTFFNIKCWVLVFINLTLSLNFCFDFYLMHSDVFRSILKFHFNVTHISWNTEKMSEEDMWTGNLFNSIFRILWQDEKNFPIPELCHHPLLLPPLQRQQWSSCSNNQTITNRLNTLWKRLLPTVMAAQHLCNKSLHFKKWQKKTERTTSTLLWHHHTNITNYFFTFYYIRLLIVW